MNHTPNPLAGNPHYYDANTDAPPGQYQVAQAVLALAFEVRTANLIAVQKSAIDTVLSPGVSIENKAEAGAGINSLNDQINTRLGLENDDA